MLVNGLPLALLLETSVTYAGCVNIPMSWGQGTWAVGSTHPSMATASHLASAPFGRLAVSSILPGARQAFDFSRLRGSVKVFSHFAAGQRVRAVGRAAVWPARAVSPAVRTSGKTASFLLEALRSCRRSGQGLRDTDTCVRKELLQVLHLESQLIVTVACSQ